MEYNYFGADFCSLRRLEGRSWPLLGRCGALLGLVGAVLGPSWGLLGRSWELWFGSRCDPGVRGGQGVGSGGQGGGVAWGEVLTGDPIPPGQIHLLLPPAILAY